MSDNEELLLLAVAAMNVVVCAAIKKKNKKKRRKLWAKKWLQRRDIGRGVLNMLNYELLIEDADSYRNFLRLPNEYFEILLGKVSDIISKQDTPMRPCITARNKLEVTLRFLATGETFRSLMYSTRIHESTISKFIIEVCDAIYIALKDEYLNTPSTNEEWKKIAEDFFNVWQFPHCLGALDGRHITFRPPRSDGSYYFNYKGENSIVLLAVADANYKFIYANVGCNGRISDGGVFRESCLNYAIQNNTLNFPPEEILPGRHMKVPYVFVADDAFPLHNNIMKPYPNRRLSRDERIFNYRLSRARRIVENSFGILANRFRVLLTPISLRPSKVEKITITCVVLHNFLATLNKANYTSYGTEENEHQLRTLGQQGGNRSSNLYRNYRNEFKEYFCQNGAVTWQENALRNYNM